MEAVFVETIVGFLQGSILQAFQQVFGVAILCDGFDLHFYTAGIRLVSIRFRSERNETDDVILAFFQLIIPFTKASPTLRFWVTFPAKIGAI